MIILIFSGYLYQLLSAVIKGNHNNCSQFANSHRLNWLFSRLGSAGEGTGMLDVLHCVLIDSPEALNVMKVSYPVWLFWPKMVNFWDIKVFCTF